MRPLRNLLFSAMLSALCVPSAAMPIKPTQQDLLKQLKQPEVHYPVARAGWDMKPVAPKVQFPELDKVLAAGTPQARRAELFRLLAPDWQMMLLMGLAILLMRALKQREKKPAPAQVLAFPAAAEPETKAA